MITPSMARRRWKLPLTLERTGEVLREEGVRSLWFKILGETVYRRLLLLERPLQEPISAMTDRMPVEISLLKKSEIAEYLEFRAEANESAVQSQLEVGHWCFVVRHQGVLVTASWMTTDQVGIDYLSCAFPVVAGEVYEYDSFTTPTFRGQNLITALMVEIVLYFRVAGYRRLVTAVSPENHASLRACAKIGYRPYGLIGHVKIGPWKRHFYRVKNAPS